MRVTLPGDTFDDAVRGSDAEQALANASWSWPSAISNTHLAEVGVRTLAAAELADRAVSAYDAGRFA